VWLKRQEATVFKERLLAQGLSDMVVAAGGKSDNVQEAFKQYLNAIFPFRESKQSKVDEEMKRVMEREIKKGPITFKPMPMNFLKKKAKMMQIPDEWSQRLAQRNRFGRKLEP
jgi:hypothetical protein